MKAEADRRDCSRLFIVTSNTLNRKTGIVEALRQALGSRCVGTFDECSEHTPRSSVFATAHAVRAARPDLIVTFGGGTAIDTVKVLLIVLAHGLTEPGQLDNYRIGVNPDGSRRTPTIKAPPIRQIVVSTTLSAAEFSNLGGCTDTERGVKDAYVGHQIGAASVILDPAVTIYTPEWLWLSTGIRAIDHAVEGLCSIEASPMVEATALHALHQAGQHGPLGASPVHAGRVDVGLRHFQSAVWREPRHRPQLGCRHRHEPRLHQLRDAPACDAVQPFALRAADEAYRRGAR